MELELLGWIGGVYFSLCGFPQSLKSYREGHSNGVSWGLLGLWGIGEICMLIYIIPQLIWPLIVNYLANLVFVSIITYYKVKPHENRR